MVHQVGTVSPVSVACSDQRTVSRKPRKLFEPVKVLQNLEPCDYRAVLFTYSKDEGGFPSYKKFQASVRYTSPFLDADDLKMALWARKLFGAFEKRAPGPGCSRDG